MKKAFFCFFFLLAHNLLSAQEFQNLPDTIWVAITANDVLVRAEIEDMFRTSAQASFFKANQRKKQNVKFVLTDDYEYADIHYRLTGYRLVTGKEKTTAFLLTAAGIGLPIVLASSGVMMPVAFYFTPQNQYTTSVEYSPYLQEMGFTNSGEFLYKVGTGYTASDHKNEGRIAADFGQRLAMISKRWNKQHLKALKGQSNFGQASN